VACDSRLKPQQTIQQRAAEIREMVTLLDKRIASGRTKIIVDRKSGAITFTGLTDDERDGVTDACAYRRLMISGSAQTKLAIQRAEMLAGRGVSMQALAHGVHSHDGGTTWHKH
jgi:hypothetical protein